MKTLREYLSETLSSMPRNIRNMPLSIALNRDVPAFLKDGKSVLLEEKVLVIGENEIKERTLNYRHMLCARVQIKRLGQVTEIYVETNLNSLTKTQHLFDAKRRIIGLIIKEWEKR